MARRDGRLGQSQIRWSNRIASGASPHEIEAALALIRKFRLRLEADRRSHTASEGRDHITMTSYRRHLLQRR
jgi:hypothetical protein